MRWSLFVLLCVMLIVGTQPVKALHFVIYGDTRTNFATHQQVIASFSSVNPELVVHTGDLYDGYTEAQFKSALTSRPNIAALLNNNLFLVARGNHETEAAVLAFSPSIVRNDSILYSFTDGNCFFVCVGYDPAQNISWTQNRLQSTAARNATWRIVYSHVPVYSTGSGHGASGIPGFETMCDQYHVTMVFSGHDHIYERSKLIYRRAAINGTRNFILDSGTVYIVAGGGGAPLYSVGSNWWTALSSSMNHWCELSTTDDQLKMVARRINSTGFDSVTIHKAATSTRQVEIPIISVGVNDRHKTIGELQTDGPVIRIQTLSTGILTIYNPLGNLCHYVAVNSPAAEIHEVEAGTPGIYIIRMESNRGIETRKISVSR